MNAGGGSSTGEAVVYCRRARRIRWRYAGNPGRKYAALRGLSREADAGAGRVVAAEGGSAGAGWSGAGSFTDLVRRCIAGPVLPYSQRLALLRRAPRYHLTPFHANLLIAAVQYEQGRQRPAVASGRSRIGVVYAVVAVVVMEVAAAWLILGR